MSLSLKNFSALIRNNITKIPTALFEIFSVATKVKRNNLNTNFVVEEELGKEQEAELIILKPTHKLSSPSNNYNKVTFRSLTSKMKNCFFRSHHVSRALHQSATEIQEKTPN